MKFDPNAVPEEKSFSPIAEGDYEFTVTAAEERISQSGNEMVVATLTTEVGRDKPIDVREYLVNAPNSLWKARDFCAATGLDFSTGCIAADDCIGLSGKAHFANGKPNAKGHSYLEVKYFIDKEGYQEAPRKTPQTQGAAVADAIGGEEAPSIDENGDVIPF